MDAIIRFWIGFTLIAVSAIIAAAGWAFKNRQFSNKDRVRNLPVDSCFLVDESEVKKKKKKE